MKKICIALLIGLILFCFISCSNGKSVCYYGYFPDNAFVLLFSNKKNKLYYISFPDGFLSEWGSNEGIVSVPNIIRNFVGIEESGFITGNRQTHQTLRDFLDVLTKQNSSNLKLRLDAVAKHIYLLKNDSFLAKANELCGTDLKYLAEAVGNREPETEILDISVVLNGDSLEFSKEYFQQWLNQVINY